MRFLSLRPSQVVNGLEVIPKEGEEAAAEGEGDAQTVQEIKRLKYLCQTVTRDW